jgi:1-acyl-sn-glycerol-3-phosphate acyltransferase
MISTTMRLIGRIWALVALKYLMFGYTRKRVRLFDVHTEGAEHLLEMQGRSYILVCNHVRSQDSLLKIFTWKPMRRFNHSIDGFVFERIVHEHTRQWIHIVAKYGRDQWYTSRPMRFLQENVRQPLTRGQMEAGGYVPIDLKNGACRRDFLKSVARIIARREPLLIFPEGNVFHEFQADRPLQTGAAHIARSHRIPVLPAYVTGCNSWRPGQRVDVRFGEPILTDGLSKQQITEEIRQSLQTLAEMSKAA